MANKILAQLLRCRGELYGFIRAILRNARDAEDLFQEVAAAIMEHGRKGTEVRDFRAWAKEIARHHVFQYCRKQRRERTQSLPAEEMVEVAGRAFMDHSPSPDGLANETEALRNCMRRLPGPARELLRLRFVSDRSYVDIAERLRRTEAAVRRASARARTMLLDCVRNRLGRAASEA